MSSVHVVKAQPAHHLYRATASCAVLDVDGTTTLFTAGSGAVLADMGKTLVLASGTFKKVQLMPRPSAGGDEANGYKTGYICMGDGSAAASPVAVLL